MSAYFFGCWSRERIGHYLYDHNGRCVFGRNWPTPIKAEACDGSLLHGVPDVEGNAVLFHGRGWTILSFWDRSGDKRPASNSTFFLPGTLTFMDAQRAAREAFPGRWSILPFALVERQ